LTITKNTAGKAAFRNEDLSEKEYRTKLQAEAHIDELAKISVALKDNEGKKKIVPDYDNKHGKRNLAKDGWNYRTAYFKDFDGQMYKMTLSVAIDGTVESVYNVGRMKKHLPMANLALGLKGQQMFLLLLYVKIRKSQQKMQKKLKNLQENLWTWIRQRQGMWDVRRK